MLQYISTVIFLPILQQVVIQRWLFIKYILFILQYKVSTAVMDLVVVFALFVFMLVLLVFLCYRFSVNKDLYKGCFLFKLVIENGNYDYCQ